MNKELEEAMASAGFAISDELPTQEAPTQEPQETEVQAQPDAEVSAPTPEPQPEVQQVETPQAEQPVQQEAKAEDINVDQEVLQFLSERLGKDFDSFDSISEAISYKPVEIDERVAAINKFVVETGRSPEEWYRYQSLDPSEMDEMSLVRLQVSAENPSLTSDDVALLLKNKYKLDQDYHSEDEIKLSKLQLKMDAEKARKSITELRSSYEAPVVETSDMDSPIDEDWVKNMSARTNNFGYLEFDLPGNETFKFGIDDNYRKQLVQKNSKLDEYFNDYVSDSGDWNFDKLNAHRALVDNIDSIVSSIYNQGLSDGRKGVVAQAANVDASRPNINQQPDQRNKLEEQLLNALGGSTGMTFKV